MKNIPEAKLGIVAVSRDCFPMSLSVKRRTAVAAECKKAGVSIYEAQAVIENDNHVAKALEEIKAAGVNALVIYLGNFGPEGPETLLAKKFCGPVMFVAAAEETGEDLFNGRGDAYCGMLNASYNIQLRGLRVYIPEYPVGSAAEVAGMIADFESIARAYIGVKALKVFSFGPRPHDFLACNAPIKPLYDLGVEVMENSELDLFALFQSLAGDKRCDLIIADMEKELGRKMDPVLAGRLAALELSLIEWYEKTLGAAKFAVFANKCWPAFQQMFKCVPCYVNSRLTARGIPVSCEVDIYGAVSEYILTCATLTAPTLLDINNTVPADMYNQNIEGKYPYKPCDVFMGFHCGNTPMCRLSKGTMKYQLIMKRLLEPDSEPNVSRGTLEGTLISGDITLFRLQSSADCKLKAYVAEGESMDVDPRSFGSIGIIAVPEMARFYRHVLIAGGFPHHAGVTFNKSGKVLFEVLKLLGVKDIGFNRPAGSLYCGENPFGA